MSEREQLLNKEELTDKHIYAANKLLKMEFPEVAGIQSIVCLAILMPSNARVRGAYRYIMIGRVDTG